MKNFNNLSKDISQKVEKLNPCKFLASSKSVLLAIKFYLLPPSVKGNVQNVPHDFSTFELL
jgi:hypothetical protein